MKDSDWILYMFGLKGKEHDRKKKIQNQRSDADNEGKSGKDQDGSLEKTTLDKQQPKGINEEAATLGATEDIAENAEKGVSSGSKSVHESVDEPANEDVGTSCQLNDCVESPSDANRQRLANEDVGTSPQQNDVAQAKRQKME
ncbi:PREDICTED: uncharacterized protein LOC109235049 [Nicotiana attenuata]|uniref:Uncharacterized protein n=1 Tax=Nicotiana attenuata TaxID=49451 RepID=A0A1J6HWD2_NICAT|nr:PREDICTED: uncharacterized protein LOC109235049 [Nicotiana attenuata]XP_019256604.1 PREDICTED: uncharacterized protein LOC109235049 [Nicotiana attenuata]XP_019256605.1 PREDICTED: uncharacterized protein LOC109235049 [Nicotiana attenuata]OIS97149.1 hypothetical protein A4A49_10982 [Nicotiana attenuata]